MNTSPPAQPHTSLWLRLRSAGLVSAQKPEPTTTTQTPWFITILIALCGWLAAIFLLASVGMMFSWVIENKAASLITGAGLVAGAYTLLKTDKGHFSDHLALAVSFAGQALLIWGLTDNFRTAGAWLLISLIHALLAYTMPHQLHRILSALLATASFAIALNFAGMPELFPGIALGASIWLWLNEFRYPRALERITSTAYGISLAMVGYMAAIAWGWQQNWVDIAAPRGSWIAWLGEFIRLASLLYLSWSLLSRAGKRLTERVSVAVLCATLIIGVAAYYAQGLSVGAALLIIGFSSQHRLLTGVGVSSILLYLSAFYYWLDMSLLYKSQVLFVLGCSLLVVRWLVLRARPNSEIPHG